MQTLEQYVKIIFAVAATAITNLLGGWDMVLEVLITMIVIDYVSGIAKAFCCKGLSSQIGAQGIIKKVMILVIIVLASQIDRLMNTQSQLIRTAVIYFYVANEGISILENLALMGIPLPKQLKEKLFQLKGDDVK